MINDNPSNDAAFSAFGRIRSGFAQVATAMAEKSQAMRCVREAERLSRLSNTELFRLGVRRDDIVRYAFSGHLGH